VKNQKIPFDLVELEKIQDEIRKTEITIVAYSTAILVLLIVLAAMIITHVCG